MAMTNAEKQRAYQARKRAGIVLHKPDLRERFFCKVETEGHGGCWRWTASYRTTGYGQMRIVEGGRASNRGAHQISYELHKGPIPQGMDVCHTCDNRWCVNPLHLWAGTRKENVADAAAKKRMLGNRSPGEKHHQAKLTEEIVREIRCSPLKGVELATKHGVTKTTISDIRNRRSWTHI